MYSTLVKNIATATNMPREFCGKNVKATMHLRHATKKKVALCWQNVAKIATNIFVALFSYVLLRFQRGYRHILLFYLSRSEKPKNKLATKRIVASRS